MWSARSRGEGGSQSSTQRKYMWDKTQHGGASWWSSGFRDSLDGSVVSRSRYSRTLVNPDWNLEGSVYDASIAEEREAVGNWLSVDSNRGVIRIYEARANTAHSTLVLCSLTTTAQQVCLKVGLPPNALHYQLNGDVIRRMDPFDCPLTLQNDYLRCIGFDKVKRIQEEGISLELADFIRFYAGKPYLDATFSRQTLCAVLSVRKQKGLLHPWIRRLCEISGTRLLLYPGVEKTQPPDILYLVRGRVEESRGQRHHEFCLKITGYTASNSTTTTSLHGTTVTPQTAKTVYLAFDNEAELMKWSRKCNKAVTKQPDVADLSNNHLEFLPENLFVNNENLVKLNLRHNALKERPIEEDIYTIGWIDDLPRFTHLRSLNLANNDLRNFPLALCRIRTLVELNMASNKLEDIPSQIAELTCLKAIHLQANHLKELPAEMRHLKELKLLVLAFNHFTSVPTVVADMKQMDSLILAGNFVTSIPDATAVNLKHIHKLDLRMNQLELVQEIQASWEALINVTHLDLRDNNIPFLDLRGLTNLQFLNCQRNHTTLVQLSGGALSYLNASKNSVQKVSISPIPANLLHLDLSHNALTSLPDWIGELRRMETLVCNFNHLTSLPNRIFQNICSLKMLIVDHNHLTMIPDKFGSKCQLETLLIHQNKLTYLPDRFLSTCNRLRILNVSNNRLFSLPPPSAFTDQNRIQELYLAANHLQDDALEVVAKYPRLKILNLAYNDIHSLSEAFFRVLELVEELNLSGNKLTRLPDSMKQLQQLQVLKLHSNQLRVIPDFSGCTSLRVLDIGANELETVPLGSIMGESLKHLDVSFNAHLRIDHAQLQGISAEKQVTLVDMKDKTSNSSSEQTGNMAAPEALRWRIGFAQTSGNRNKLCITQLRLCPFNGNDSEALFGIFDGGFNNEIPLILTENFPAIHAEERKSRKATNGQFLRSALLRAHLATGCTGQKTGASVVVCHAVHHTDDEIWLHVVNVGHAEAVLSRNGDPILLTRKFLATEDPEECDRIRLVDGIITEDSLVNGSCTATRMIGCSYLFPSVIPDPHTVSFKLLGQDEYVVMANRALWEVMTHKEAINEIRGMSNAILAAKKLVDLAQSYGVRGNLSVIVASYNSSQVQSDNKENFDYNLPGDAKSADVISEVPQGEAFDDEDYFPQEISAQLPSRKFVYPRSASQILIMDEQVQIARSAHSLTENVEPEQNYYFQHRRDSLAEDLSSGSTSPEVASGGEKTVLTNGNDFEVHVSASRGQNINLSGNTLSGHGDSALGSSVNPSVSDGNGSPVNHEEHDEQGEIIENQDEQPSGATSHCETKSQDDEAIHSSDPMDDEECRSWQFLMNAALGNDADDDEGVEEATLEDDTLKGSTLVSEVEKPEIPQPPAPPLPPDPLLFFKAPVKFRVTQKDKPAGEADPKRCKPLIDELETVLKKRLSQMEEGIESAMAAAAVEAAATEAAKVENAEPVDTSNLIRQVKSSYQMVFRLSNPNAFVAQQVQLQSPMKRKF